MPEPIRSFIAFDIDNEIVLEKIENMQSLLVQTGSDLKLVKTQNIHVTIQFLGNILPYMIEKIYEVMRETDFTPFHIRIHGIGVFPHLRYPRVVWAGITEGVDQMQHIFDQLQPGLHNLGFTPDTKGFSPHLTIARVRTGRKKSELASRINENVNREFGVIKAKCLRLKRSNLTSKGPVYSTLKEVCPEQ